MAKYYGKVGFVSTEMTSPGVYTPVKIEKYYYGDILNSTIRWQQTEHLNDNVNVNNRISIIADKFALENFSIIKFIEWKGILWNVSSIEVKYPRLILSIGGEYNEQ